MNKATLLAFTAYATQIATLNAIANPATKFTVEPSVQQKLEDRMQESSEFLSKINLVPVDEMKGEKLGLGISGPIASRTNTDVVNKERTTSDPTSLQPNSYECVQTNFDTHIKYKKLDMWAKFPDFQTRIRDHILERQRLDRIMIGFNGTHAANDTDKAANPLLQDVNRGWLQAVREDAPERVMDDVAGGKVAGKVTYGAAGDYKTLDALVWDAKQQLLAAWAREDTELVVLCSSDLLHDKYFPIINTEDKPTEQLARDVIMSSKRLGNLPAYTVPFFPAGTVLITRFDNLSLYYQDGKRRRALIDNPKKDQIENFESSNDAYVVEDYDYAALVENIQEKAA